MAEHTVEFLEWIQLLSPFWAYVILIGIAYGENIIPPVPGDIAIVFGGYLAGTGQLNFFMVVGLATVGGALGFMTMFWIGRRFGDAALDPDRLRWLPKRGIYRARLWLLKWGYALVGANRFLSGLRSVISLTVGAAQMNAWKTALFATISALLWATLIAYMGAVVGENWSAVSSILRSYGTIVGGVILMLILLKLGHVWWRHSRRKSSPSDAP